MNRELRVLALGGTPREGSDSELALRLAGEAAGARGAEVRYITGRDLILPIYDPGDESRAPEAQALIDAVKWADGLVIASPGYHGGMSGMIKNALDYVEDLRDHERVYLDGLPVGLIAVARGWQAAVSTLQGLRTVVHALRGWPTPYGAAINSSPRPEGETPAIEAARDQLTTVAAQVVDFARAANARPGG